LIADESLTQAAIEDQGAERDDDDRDQRDPAANDAK
jgi:hypothetical protein